MILMIALVLKATVYLIAYTLRAAVYLCVGLFIAVFWITLMTWKATVALSTWAIPYVLAGHRKLGA